MTRTISATTPIARSIHDGQRSARYSANGVREIRIAIHSAASTAGKPIITESEIVRPAPTTWTAAEISIGPPRRSINQATTPIWPMNIAAKMNRPHNAVPQNLQMRGGRWVPMIGVSAGAADPTGISRESIK